MLVKIAILGWGSLLWDCHKEFDDQHEEWRFDGPNLKLEFSRVSESRSNVLTLVIDPTNGKSCRVAYAFSKRKSPDDAICDLRCREGTAIENIGFFCADGSRKYTRDTHVLEDVRTWATEKNIDFVTWTNLESNFEKKSSNKMQFSVQNALLHIQSLDAVSKAKASEYVWRAPNFIDTPLRNALQSQPWFQNTATL
jgi:hypothetical protein